MGRVFALGLPLGALHSHMEWLPNLEEAGHWDFSELSLPNQASEHATWVHVTSLVRAVKAKAPHAVWSMIKRGIKRGLGLRWCLAVKTLRRSKRIGIGCYLPALVLRVTPPRGAPRSRRL